MVMRNGDMTKNKLGEATFRNGGRDGASLKKG